MQRKTLNRDVAPIGDNIEPIEAPREMGNDEAEIPRARIRIVPGVERNKKIKIQDKLFIQNGCAASSEGRGVGGQHRSELLEEEERENHPDCFRCHFGSSHFLFERAYDFSASRDFLILTCSSVYNPVL